MPALAIVRHLLYLALFCARSLLRFFLVVFVWLALLPFAVRGVWQGFFQLGRSWGQGWLLIVQDIDWSSKFPFVQPGAAILKAKPTSLAAQMQVLRTSFEGADSVTVTRLVNGVQVSSSVRPPLDSLGNVYRDFYALWGRSIANTSALHASTPQVIGKLIRMSLFNRDQGATNALARQLYQRHKRFIG